MSTIVVVISLAPVLLISFLLFDKLVRLEYESHRRHWDADGQPHGFFWVPPEVKKFGGWVIKGRSSIASRRCALVWLFSTPDWVRQDPIAKRLLFGLRFFVGVWNAGVLMIALLVFFT